MAAILKLCHIYSAELLHFYFYHGPLPVRQGHGHGASYFSRGRFNFGEVGFGGPWVSAMSALVLHCGSCGCCFTSHNKRRRKNWKETWVVCGNSKSHTSPACSQKCVQCVHRKMWTVYVSVNVKSVQCTVNSVQYVQRVQYVQCVQYVQHVQCAYAVSGQWCDFPKQAVTTDRLITVPGSGNICLTQFWHTDKVWKCRNSSFMDNPCFQSKWSGSGKHVRRDRCNVCWH